MATSGSRSVPTASIRADFGGVRASFALRVGFNATTYDLKQEAIAAFRKRCKEEGRRCMLPSEDIADFALTPCVSDGTSILPHAVPLPDEGSITVRTMMATPSYALPHPLVLMLHLGINYQRRADLLTQEAYMRNLIYTKQLDARGNLQFLGDVSEEKSLELEYIRSAQEKLAAPIEEAMLEGFCKYYEYQLRVRWEQSELERCYDVFDERLVPASIALIKDYEQQKRILLRRSEVATRTHAAAGVLV